MPLESNQYLLFLPQLAPPIILLFLVLTPITLIQSKVIKSIKKKSVTKFDPYFDKINVSVECIPSLLAIQRLKAYPSIHSLSSTGQEKFYCYVKHDDASCL